MELTFMEISKAEMKMLIEKRKQAEKQAAIQSKAEEICRLIKELEARGEMENILIICPKPLVAERKWEMEMRRFDEDFLPVDGPTLRQIISDCHRDEEWSSRYSKAIIPYSILDSRIYEGQEQKKGKQYGLLDLDPVLSIYYRCSNPLNRVQRLEVALRRLSALFIRFQTRGIFSRRDVFCISTVE